MPTLTNTEELTEQLTATLKAAQAIAATAEDEDRDFTDAERDDLKAKMTEATGLKEQLTKAKGDAQMRATVQQLGEGIGLGDGTRGGAARTTSGLIVPDGSKSIGHHFVDSDQYKALIASAPNGQFGEKMRVQSQPVGYKTLVTGAGDDSGGALVQPDWRGMVTGGELFQRPLVLRDLVTSGTTTSDTIEYARITGYNNAAAPVAEATATADGSGTKPESGFTTGRMTANVRTIAHWIPATKRALSDPAQIRTLIDAFLRYGLEEELENQMVSGDGLGENFQGVANVSGVQAQAAVADPTGKPAGFGMLLAARRAKTLVRLVGRAVANGFVMNPNDWQAMEEISDNQGRFYGDGPFGTGNAPALWGLPVVECEAIPAGTAYVGDWRKAILWDREQASVTVSDSHADFFVRNMVAILAEMRAAFGVVQPSAFVEIDLTAEAPAV